MGAKFHRWAGNADGCVAVSARGGARGLRRRVKILRVFVARICRVEQIHSFGLTCDMGAKFYCWADSLTTSVQNLFQKRYSVAKDRNPRYLVKFYRPLLQLSDKTQVSFAKSNLTR